MALVEEETLIRLREAGLDPERIGHPAAAFVTLVERLKERATLIDRYVLEALARGITVDQLAAEDRDRLWVEVSRLRYPELEVLGPGRGDPVEIVPYDQRWPLIFAAWKKRLREALREVAITVHHIGSTAVPGLPAKPVVDMLVGVGDVEDEARFVPPLERLLLQLRSREPGHRYFRPPPGTPRLIQVHVCRAGSDWERTHLAFRDLLRSDPHLAAVYAALKVKLARRFRHDRLAYTEGKTGFILDALARH